MFVQQSAPKCCCHLLIRLYTHSPKCFTSRFCQLISSSKMSQSCSKWGHKPEGPCSVLLPSVRKNLETTWCKVQTASPLSTLLALQSDSGVLDCLDPGKGKYLRCIFKDTPVKNKAVLRPAEKEFPNSTVSPNQMLSEITPA